MKRDAEDTQADARGVTATLPGNHQRALHSRLSSVEQHLQSILDVAEGRNRDGIFTQFDDQLSPEMVEIVQQWVEDFRCELGVAKQRLGVGTHSTRVAQALNANLATAWVALEDSRPHNLQGYGDLSPELTAVLNDVISRLLECLAGFPARMPPSAPEQ